MRQPHLPVGQFVIEFSFNTDTARLVASAEFEEYVDIRGSLAGHLIKSVFWPRSPVSAE